MVAPRFVLFLTVIGVLGTVMVVPEFRCAFNLRMPAGACRDTGEGRQTPLPRVDPVMIAPPFRPTPPPVLDPPPPPPPTPDPPVIPGALPVQMIRLLTEADLEGKSDWELDIMRNEIYARLGRGFDRDDLRRYFSQFSWYQPVYGPQEFDDYHQNLLTGTQRANAEFILRYQHSMR